MKQRGRKSAASLAITPVLEHKPVPVQPPATLSEPARAVFLDLVGNCHPEHFEDSDVGLLCQYCEAQAMAERAAAELQNGTGEAAEWALKLWEKANKVMSGLALRLRLGPQSRREKAKVARPLTWSERFCMEQAQNRGAPSASRWRAPQTLPFRPRWCGSMPVPAVADGDYITNEELLAWSERSQQGTLDIDAKEAATKARLLTEHREYQWTKHELGRLLGLGPEDINPLERSELGGPDDPRIMRALWLSFRLNEAYLDQLLWWRQPPACA